jgi:protein involved in polysaccharide export with SLBB domain
VFACLPVAYGQPLPDPPGIPLGDKKDQRDTRMPIAGPNQETLSGDDVGRSSSVPSIPLEGPIDPNNYVCGPGDRFELTFWGKQNFRLQLAADFEGRVFISKIGFVNVTGKTLAASRAIIKKKVQGNYPGLGFELVLTRPRTFLIHVAENVKEPGAYSSSALERVSSIIARAGGVTGTRRRISIKRADGSELTADLLKYERTGDTKYNPLLLDGDVIRVPLKGTYVKITGAVNYPGQYELVDAKDLNELLGLAGGFRPDVAKDIPARLVRRNKKQQEAFTDLPFDGEGGAPENIALMYDDEIIVQGAHVKQRSVLLLGAVLEAGRLDPAITSARLPYIEGDTLRSLIERAGGITSPGDLTRAYISRKVNGVQQTIPVNLDALLVRREFAEDKPVMMGDVIVVPAMRHSILIEGAVVHGGFYPFNPQFGINEYINNAGGRTRNAQSLSDTKVVRPDGTTLSFKTDLKPAPGDTIMVPERSFSRAETVQIVMAVAGLVLSGVAITLAATQ